MASGCICVQFDFLLHKGFWSSEFRSRHHGSFCYFPSLLHSWPTASSQPLPSGPRAPATAFRGVCCLCCCPSATHSPGRRLSSQNNTDGLAFTHPGPAPEAPMPSARSPSPLWAHANQADRAGLTCSVPVSPVVVSLARAGTVAGLATAPGPGPGPLPGTPAHFCGMSEYMIEGMTLCGLEIATKRRWI